MTSPRFSNNVIAALLLAMHFCWVLLVGIVSSIYPDMIGPHCLKNAKGGSITFVNFLGQVHRPFGRAVYLKRVPL